MRVTHRGGAFTLGQQSFPECWGDRSPSATLVLPWATQDSGAQTCVSLSAHRQQVTAHRRPPQSPPAVGGRQGARVQRVCTAEVTWEPGPTPDPQPGTLSTPSSHRGGGDDTGRRHAGPQGCKGGPSTQLR